MTMTMSEGEYQESRGLADAAGEPEPAELAGGDTGHQAYIPDPFEGLPEEPHLRVLDDDYREIGPLAAVAELYSALARAQSRFSAITKNRTAKIQSAKGSYSFDFADLETILAATRKYLNAEGIFLTQPASQVAPGEVVLRTTLARGLAKVQLVTRFGYEGDIKAFGGTISYHRRYHLNSALGVSADADADDGPSESELAGSSGPRQGARPPMPTQATPAASKAPSARADRPSERPPGFAAGPVTEEQKAGISAEVRRLGWQAAMVTTECRRVTGGATTDLDVDKAAKFLTHLRMQKAGQ